MFVSIEVSNSHKSIHEGNNMTNNFSTKYNEIISKNNEINQKDKNLKRKYFDQFKNELQNRENIKNPLNTCECCIDNLNEGLAYNKILNSQWSRLRSRSPNLPQSYPVMPLTKMDNQSKEEIKLSLDIFRNENHMTTQKINSKIMKYQRYLSKMYLKSQGFGRNLSQISKTSNFALPDLTPINLNKQFNHHKAKYFKPSYSNIFKITIKNNSKIDQMNELKRRMRDGQFGVLESLASFRRKLQNSKKVSFLTKELSYSRLVEDVNDCGKSEIKEFNVNFPALVDVQQASPTLLIPPLPTTTSLTASTKSTSSSSPSSSPNVYGEYNEEHDYKIPLKKRKTKYLKDVGEIKFDKEKIDIKDSGICKDFSSEGFEDTKTTTLHLNSEKLVDKTSLKRLHANVISETNVSHEDRCHNTVNGSKLCELNHLNVKNDQSEMFESKTGLFSVSVKLKSSNRSSGYSNKHSRLTNLTAEQTIFDNGDSALHMVIRRSEALLADSLICNMNKLNVTLDKYNNDKRTPLHLCVQYDNMYILQQMLIGGASCNVPDADGNTTVHLAIQYTNITALAIIFHNSTVFVDESAKNKKGQTIFDSAFEFEISRQYLDHLFNINLSTLMTKYDSTTKLSN